jgi:disulfide bond formation protein DsbB
MLKLLKPQNTALLVGLAALATILGAWTFEHFGYLPCELCLKQRIAYYAAIPLAFFMAVARPRQMQGLLVVLGLLWLGSAVFGVYHSGVEWHWWAGPETCSAGAGDLGSGTGLPDLSKRGVMCNEAALRIFGLSLAGWNAVISAALSALSFATARRSARS